MVHVGVGDEDTAYLQPEPLHGERDAGRLVAGVYERAYPGLLVFHAEDEGIVFSGDALFAGSVGRVDLPGGSMEILMRSITGKLLPLPDETRVLSGHGPETTIGRERMTNPFLAGRVAL